MLAFLLAFGAGPALGQFSYTTLDHPLAGAGGTVAYDLDGGRIVGTYLDAAGVSHAFTYDGATWTTLDHPAAAAPRGTAAFGVSGGNVVGTYVDATGQVFGYVYDGREWTTLTRPPPGPGRTDTFARGVSGSTVVGHYIESQVARGFVYDAGTFTDVVVPGAVGTFPDDTDDGRIVGSFEDLLGTHGFISDGTGTTVLDHPLGTLGTFVTGVDGAAVVGTYLGLPDASAHGFLYEGGRYTPIDIPGATDTSVNGIDGLRVVGSYVDAAGATHGFLLTIPEPSAAAVALLALWLPARRPRRRRRAAAPG